MEQPLTCGRDLSRSEKLELSSAFLSLTRGLQRLGDRFLPVLETKEYFTYNLVVWRISIWSFGFFPHQPSALLSAQKGFRFR